jgi:hypothetical protein
MRIFLLACASLTALFLHVPGSSAQRIDSRVVDARALPREVAHRGSVVAARRWNDGLGENWLLLTKSRCLTPNLEAGTTWCGDEELYAYHYVRKNGAYSLLWTTFDSIRECGEDVTLAHSPRTLAITDLDRDGVAETTFVYLLACRGGLDPATMKLIMHEGAVKYAIRGSTDLRDVGPGYGPGHMTLDPAFSRAPRPFRDFAVAHWNRFVRESSWRDVAGL